MSYDLSIRWPKPSEVQKTSKRRSLLTSLGIEAWNGYHRLSCLGAGAHDFVCAGWGHHLPCNREWLVISHLKGQWSISFLVWSDATPFHIERALPERSLPCLCSFCWLSPPPSPLWIFLVDGVVVRWSFFFFWPSSKAKLVHKQWCSILSRPSSKATSITVLNTTLGLGFSLGCWFEPWG